jgi:hypothetical protein
MMGGVAKWEYNDGHVEPEEEEEDDDGEEMGDEEASSAPDANEGGSEAEAADSDGPEIALEGVADLEDDEPTPPPSAKSKIKPKSLPARSKPATSTKASKSRIATKPTISATPPSKAKVKGKAPVKGKAVAKDIFDMDVSD